MPANELHFSSDFKDNIIIAENLTRYRYRFFLRNYALCYFVKKHC